MNRAGQMFYCDGWHVVMLVVDSYMLEDEWIHDLVSLTDLEELIGTNLVGKIYSWSEKTAASQHPNSSWKQL